MIPAEVTAATRILLVIAAPSLDALVSAMLFAASEARGDTPPAVQWYEVAAVTAQMPQLDSSIVQSSGAQAAYASMVAAVLRLAEAARANPSLAESSTSAVLQGSAESSAI